MYTKLTQNCYNSLCKKGLKLGFLTPLSGLTIFLRNYVRRELADLRFFWKKCLSFSKAWVFFPWVFFGRPKKPEKWCLKFHLYVPEGRWVLPQRLSWRRGCAVSAPLWSPPSRRRCTWTRRPCGSGSRGPGRSGSCRTDAPGCLSLSSEPWLRLWIFLLTLSIVIFLCKVCLV